MPSPTPCPGPAVPADHVATRGNGRWTKPLVFADTAKEAVADTPAAPASPATPVTDENGHPAAQAAEPGVPTVRQLEERLTAVARAIGRHERSLATIEDRLSALERRVGEHEPERRAPASLIKLLVDLDERLTTLESLPSVMEEIAAEQFQRLAPEFLALPSDVEGLHQELDAVREHLAARDATVADHLERATVQQQAVHRLRDDLGEVIAKLTAALEPVKATDERLRALELRVKALDSNLQGRRGRATKDQAAPSRSAKRADRPARARNTAEEPVRGATDKAVEVLTAEVDRIRQSLEALTAVADGR